MAFTLIEDFGKGISTEKFLLRATTDNASATTVKMTVINEDSTTYAEIEHDPDLGTSDEFSFELASIIKDMFEFEFLDLSASDSFNTQVGYFGVVFQEFEGTTPAAQSTLTQYKIKNITQDVFEIESFDLENYDVGDTGSSLRKFLTSAPTPKSLTEGESEFITASTWSVDVSKDAKQRFVVESYDANDNLINTVNYTLKTQPDPTNLLPEASGGQYYDNSAIRIEGEDGVSYKLVYIEDVVGNVTGVTSNSFSQTPNAVGEFFNPAQDVGNGLIIRMPNGSAGQQSVKAIDPISETVTDLVTPAMPSSPPAVWNYRSFIFNGSLLAVPYNATRSIRYEISSGNISLLSEDFSGGSQYFDGAVSPNGSAYLSPSDQTQIAKIDSNFNVTRFGALPAGNNKYGACAFVGFVFYAFPWTGGNILKIDTENGADTITTIATGLGGFDTKAVTIGNYIFTVSKSGVLYRFNAITEAFDTIVDTGVSDAHWSLDIGSDGFVYYMGFANNNTVVVNPITLSYVTVGLTKTTPYSNIVSFSTNGNLYALPVLSTDPIIEIIPGSKTNVVRSETRRLNNDTQCQGVRVHWLNELGEQDSFTFTGQLVKEVTNDVASFERVRPVNPLSTDVGELVYSIDYNQQWRLFTSAISPEFVEWLAKMLRNNRASIEVNGKYFPIIITDSRAITLDEEKVVNQFSIRFRFANKRKGLQ